MPALKGYRYKKSSGRERQQRSLGTSWNLRSKVIGFMLVVALFGVSWVYYTSDQILLWLKKETIQLTAKAGFRLKDVIVDGRRRISKEELLNKLAVKKDMPILAIDPYLVKDQLKELIWVKSVSVERRLPGTIIIKIAERIPVALWHNQSKVSLLDKEGVVIPITNLASYEHLMKVTGSQAPKHMAFLSDLLNKFPALKSRITQAKHLRAKRWDIYVDGRIDIKLPENHPDKAIGEFLRLEKCHNLTQKDIVTIDMRLPEQLILRLSPKAVARKNNKGKDA